MKNILLTLTTLFMLATLAVLYIGHSENPQSVFNSYDEMESSGIIRRGWVSEFIPRSAYEIEERHNIDTNTVHLSFKYDSSEGDKLNGSCAPLATNEKGWKYICPPYLGRSSIITLRKDGVGYYESYSDGLGY